MKPNLVRVFKDIKNKRWTIYCALTNKHLGYKKSLSLAQCKLVVIEEKRLKVVKTKKRFPHAWIIGEITTMKSSQKKVVSYNPFQDHSFMIELKPIKKAKILTLDKSGKVLK